MAKQPQKERQGTNVEQVAAALAAPAGDLLAPAAADTSAVDALAERLFALLLPQSIGRAKTVESLARDCYAYAREFLGVRQKQQQQQRAAINPTPEE